MDLSRSGLYLRLDEFILYFSIESEHRETWEGGRGRSAIRAALPRGDKREHVSGFYFWRGSFRLRGKGIRNVDEDMVVVKPACHPFLFVSFMSGPVFMLLFIWFSVNVHYRHEDDDQSGAQNWKERTDWQYERWIAIIKIMIAIISLGGWDTLVAVFFLTPNI